MLIILALLPNTLSINSSDVTHKFSFNIYQYSIDLTKKILL